MENELNTLTYDNTKVTFTGQTNNIATSDELYASPIYQDKMGTAYSRSKMILKAFNFTGISLILTAAAIKTGSFISNAYVLNPPSISEASYEVKDQTFNFKFTVSNPNKYDISYCLYVNEQQVLKENCSEPKTYQGKFDGLKIGDAGRFFIEFTNRVDYKKAIAKYTFTVEGIDYDRNQTR